jgi:heterodisulfide reductase subunit A2
VEVKVGAIILAPGFEPFDPKLREDYGYGKFANVVTSMDYERLYAPPGHTKVRCCVLPT